MNGRHIITITLYEMKLISRDWTFRFLAFLILCVVVTFHVCCHSQWRIVETMISLPACIPYVNAFIYNILQSVAVALVAGNFLCRDRITRTNDALSTRPFSNVEYILGKKIALIGCFLVINILVMIAGILIHGFASESSLVLPYYFFYLFTLTLPSLFFITCLAMALRLFLKSHVLSVSILLCYLFLDATVLSVFEYGVLDFTAMRVPNFFSTLPGHPALESYLVHRVIFLLLGAGMIACFIPFYKRISNDLSGRSREIRWGIVCFSGVTLLGFCYLYPFHRVEMNRVKYIATNIKFEVRAKVNVLKHEIIYIPKGNEYAAISKMLVVNNHENALDSLFFYLNPGLKVRRVQVAGRDYETWQEHQVFGVKYHLAAGDCVDLTIDYEGGIDESVAYLDVDKQTYRRRKLENVFFCYGNRYAFLDEEFILLTPECLWYPVSYPPVNLKKPHFSRREFSDYSLKFIHSNDLSVISQGTPERRGDTLCFSGSENIFGITLVAGNFKKDSARAPGYVLLEFYNRNNHFAWQGVLETSQELKDQCCDFLEPCSFPFDKLMFVEVPLSFHTFWRSWRDETEYVQPGIVFLPEWQGIPVNYQKLLETKLKFDSSLTMESVVKFNILNQYRTMFSVDKIRDPLEEFVFPGENEWNKYCFSALSKRHSIFIYSDEFPDIDGVIADMKEDVIAEIRYGPRGEMEREALRRMEGKTTRAIMESPEMHVLIKTVRYLKSGHLWRNLAASVRWEDLVAFIHGFHERYQNRSVTFERFAEEFYHELEFDLLSATRELYDGKGLPRFWLRDVQIENLTVEQKQRMMSFKLWNRGETSGIVSLFYRDANQLRILKCWKIESNACRKINYYVDGETASVVLNLGLASNNPVNYLPFTCRIKDTAEMDILIDSSFFKSPGEIIVDDEDAGFAIIEKKNRWLLGKTWKDREVRLKDRYMPEGWCYTMQGYGEVLKRRCFKSVGNGKSKVEWKARVKEDGIYQLFIYNYASSVVNYNLAPHNYSFLHDGWEERITLSFSECPKYDDMPGVISSVSYTPEITVKINHNDGKTEDFKSLPGKAWIPAGTYRLSKGEIKLVLNVPGVLPGQLYCADAVKWVKQSN